MVEWRAKPSVAFLFLIIKEIEEIREREERLRVMRYRER